jgi:thiol-disulfide isomerase/thioredoxin
MAKKYLSEKDIITLLKLSSEEIADFDCGAECSKRNRNKVPYCCDIEKVIPVLYRAEFDYFSKRSKMWREFKPRNKAEREMAEELEGYNMLAKCRGVAKCERENRGFVCRNFPTYPYFNKSGKVVGMFFSRTLNPNCILIDKPDLIRKEYIRSQIKFWNYIFDRVPGEREFHMKFAKTSEKRMKSIGKEFFVMR